MPTEFHMPSRDCLTPMPTMQAADTCQYILLMINQWISDPGENVACAGSFAYRRSLLKKTWYPPTSTNGEELGFTNNFSLSKVDLDSFSTMICIAHEDNTFDKRHLRENLSDGENSNFFAGTKKIKGDRSFFEASEYKRDDQLEDSEWKKIYDLLNKNNGSQHLEKENFFYVTSSPSKLDMFANFVIKRLSQ